MKKIIVTRAGEVLVARPILRDSLRVGRGGTNDLSLPGKMVSRCQFELTLVGGGWKLKDLSGNGTVVDGVLRKVAEVTDKTRIEAGGFELRMCDVQDNAATTFAGGGTALMPSASTGDRHKALSLVGRVRGKTVRVALKGVLNVGSDDGNDLVIKDKFVSGYHCRFFIEKGKLYVTDLDSKNGTIVAGIPVGKAQIGPGCLIQLGNVFLNVRAVADENEDFPGFHGIVSREPKMSKIFDLIERAAPTDETVIIMGETGTGKELVAEAIHRLSPRCSNPMLTLNCSAVSKELIESEFFGHLKGSFTGALDNRMGIFEEADNGNIFLDEIGEMPLELQPKLLRVLEKGEVKPIGTNKPKHVNTRVLAGTHRKLGDMVGKGAFREDLYFRLNVIEIVLPPLRERKKDIPLLAKYFLKRDTRNAKKKDLSKAAIEKLKEYSYPGNVRELANTITKATLACDGNTIEPEHIKFSPPTLEEAVEELQTIKTGKSLEDLEAEAINRSLEANLYNFTVVADELKVARSTLLRKIKKYGLKDKK